MEQLASISMETNSLIAKPPQTDESTLQDHFKITFTYHSINYNHKFIHEERKSQLAMQVGENWIFLANSLYAQRHWLGAWSHFTATLEAFTLAKLR